MRKNKYFREGTITVKVVDGLTITDLKASKVNVLTATFAAPVDTDDVTVAVSKNNNAVDATVTWNEEKTIATITTTAKMTVGTYTVKATSKTDASKVTEKSVEIENQYVASIQILNDVALTGSKMVSGSAVDAMQAYVYYKVLDQYGEDLTASTSIQWSTSCRITETQRSEGKLTLERTDDKAFTYGEQIYVTGVYTKTGISVNSTLTIGAAQALHGIEMAGFVKKNTSKLLDSLPSGFKTGEYYLVYDAVDQNGNALKADEKYSQDQITFISDNVLVIREIKGGATTVVIDGHEYNAILVEPGDYVNRGGEVNITAIATKTANKSQKNYVVGMNQILTSFTMSSPSEIIADGESIEIPFQALDQDGEKITNFVTLADNLNKLNFSVSDGQVILAEQNDGTAKLVYYDKAVGWDESVTTDGIDRTVSITSVVVGGGSDNLLLSISDKARPDAISAVDMDSALMEGATVTIDNTKFTFLDQYGRTINSLNYGISGRDNGFFEATKNGGVPGLDFSGYAYNIVMEYKGNKDALVTSGGISADTPFALVDLGLNGSVSAEVDAKTRTSLTGNTFTFAIAKAKKDDRTLVNKYENVSTVYNKTFAVVDISQVRNFTVADFNKQYVNTPKSDFQTGQLGNINNSNVTNPAIGANIPGTHTQTVILKGSFNGTSVTVPSQYYTVAGTKVGATNAAVAALGENIISAVSDQAIKWSDLYDVTTSAYLRKDTSDLVKVTIYEVYSNETNGQPALGTPLTLNAGTVTESAILKDSVSKTIIISDAKPRATTLQVPETYTVNPTNTSFAAVSIWNAIEGMNNRNYTHTVLDQYGIERTNITQAYKLSQIEESAGYADNNFAVSGNDTSNATAIGAERADTFVLTIAVTDNEYRNVIAKDIKVTVGADTNAKVVNNTNIYTDVLKKLYLEEQRKATLK